MTKTTTRIDRYIRLEIQLEQATSREQEERLITELGKLEMVHGITTDDVKRRKQERTVNRKREVELKGGD